MSLSKCISPVCKQNNKFIVDWTKLIHWYTVQFSAKPVDCCMESHSWLSWIEYVFCTWLNWSLSLLVFPLTGGLFWQSGNPSNFMKFQTYWLSVAILRIFTFRSDMCLLGWSKVELFSDFEGNEEPELSGVYSLTLKNGWRKEIVFYQETCEKKCSKEDLGGFACVQTFMWNACFVISSGFS